MMLTLWLPTSGAGVVLPGAVRQSVPSPVLLLLRLDDWLLVEMVLLLKLVLMLVPWPQMPVVSISRPSLLLPPGLLLAGNIPIILLVLARLLLRLTVLMSPKLLTKLLLLMLLPHVECTP